MFQIKICGLTKIENAREVARLGADAVGLNFYEKSPRYVSVNQAAEIATALPDDVVKVGLFVNESAEAILSVASDVPLDLVQLHGDEEPAFLKSLGSLKVMKAFRINAGSLSAEIVRVQKYLAECQTIEAMPALILLDAYSPKEYGGTGQQLPWNELAGLIAQVPIVLAGGLNANNVAEAISVVGPAAVDTSSGVESQPGMKDLKQVEAFIQNARRVF